MVDRRPGRRAEAAEGRGAEAARTARISRLLEQAAHEGEYALELLVRARALHGHAGPGDDAARLTLLRDLGQRLGEVEREGSRRIRKARLLLRPLARLVRP